MKTPHQQRIEEFMRKAGQERPDTPCIPSEEIRLLRAKLIMEEAIETVVALGFCVDLVEGLPVFETHADGPNLVEIADGCADISVVTIGTLSACGISDSALLQEVDDSNLAKFTGDAHRRADGKWIKPSDWQPPDIVRVLNMQTYDPGEAPSKDVFHPLDDKVATG